MPGGVATPLAAHTREHILSELPKAIAIAECTIQFFQGALDSYKEGIEFFGSFPSRYEGLVDAKGRPQLYDVNLRFRKASGKIAEDQIEPDAYREWIGEASLRDSYLKAPYFKPQGFPAGVYRVGPLGRLNTADSCGTPKADQELKEFRQRFGTAAHSAFLYHYARLMEVTYALERMEAAGRSADSRDTRAGSRGRKPERRRGNHRSAARNADSSLQSGRKWRHRMGQPVATGHNNLASGKSVQQVSEHFIDGNKLSAGMVNRVSAVVRAYDPSLSCSTHANGLL